MRKTRKEKKKETKKREETGKNRRILHSYFGCVKVSDACIK